MAPSTRPSGDEGQAQQGDRIIVGGDPVVTLQIAAEAPVQDDLFALRAMERADGRHQGTA